MKNQKIYAHRPQMIELDEDRSHSTYTLNNTFSILEHIHKNEFESKCHTAATSRERIIEIDYKKTLQACELFQELISFTITAISFFYHRRRPQHFF